MRIGQNDRGDGMKNNKGFSLVELLVVIMLMGLFLVATPRVDAIFGYSAKEANSKIYNGITSFKTSYMGKSRSQEKCTMTALPGSGTVNPNLDMYMEIYKNNKGIYFVKFYEKGSEEKVEKLGPKRMNIQYTLKNDPTKRDIGTEGHGLVLAFDRATGGFLPVEVGGSGDGSYVQYIYCSSGSKEYTNELFPKTGKVKKVK